MIDVNRLIYELKEMTKKGSFTCNYKSYGMPRPVIKYTIREIIDLYFETETVLLLKAKY